MQFTLGSDVGIRGLPGQLISGDSGFSFNDTVGAGGVLVRWLQGNQWSTELGWVNSFQTSDNPGPWTDWLLGKGLYAKVQFRF